MVITMKTIGDIVGIITIIVAITHPCIQLAKMMIKRDKKYLYPKEASLIKYFMIVANLLMLLFVVSVNNIPMLQLNYIIAGSLNIVILITLMRRKVKW